MAKRSDSQDPDVPTEDLAAEVERLRIERDELDARLKEREERRARRGRGRSLAATLLTVLACVAITVTVPAVWTYRTLFVSDAFVDRVTPIGFDPAVTPVLSDRLTTQIFGLIDVDAIVAEALPPRGQILAGPLTGGIEDFVREKLNEVLSSGEFRDRWIQANRFAHAQIVAVLRNQSEIVDTTGGRVVLNLLPIANQALQRIESQAAGLFQRDIDLPEVTGGEVPDEVRDKISSALGVDVPEDFGEIVVFESDKLEAAQDAVSFFDRAIVFLVIFTLVLIALALWMSRRRRRTLLQLVVGSMVGIVVVRRLAMWVEDEVVELAQRPDGERALAAITDQVLGSFFSITAIVIGVGLAIVAIALITGQYGWAVTARARTAALARGIATTTGDPSRQESTVVWVRAHREALQLAGAIVFVLLLLFLDLSLLGFLLFGGLLALYEIWLARLGAGDVNDEESLRSPEVPMRGDAQTHA
jgi:multisubunit Na+/H+ antiporter MnhC subunit